MSKIFLEAFGDVVFNGSILQRGKKKFQEISNIYSGYLAKQVLFVERHKLL